MNKKPDAKCGIFTHVFVGCLVSVAMYSATQAQDKMYAAHLKAESAAETALTVRAGHIRCGWPVPDAQISKIAALLKYYKAHSSDVQYAINVGTANDTASVGENEFCFGSKWHPIFNSALQALVSTPYPPATK